MSPGRPEFNSPYDRHVFMPYKDHAVQKAWQLEWMRKRREEWFRIHGPCKFCQSWIDLNLHHRDPGQKVNHRVWSWSKDRRETELSKCDVLCERCHQRLHGNERIVDHGNHGYRRGCRCDICRAWKSAALKRETRRAGRARMAVRFPRKEEGAGSNPAASSSFCGREVQPAERRLGKAEVVGSRPTMA